MFLVYINDAPDYICSSPTITLFADDSKLYRAIIQPGCGNHLQKDLDGLHKWSQDWSMDFNGIKCKVMHIAKKKISSATKRNYTLDDLELENVPYITDLGIIVSNNMSWNRHIEATVMRANKNLGLLKRVCKEMRDPNIRKLLYCALVRPKLEYGSNLWSPYTSKHRALLENIQCRATKFLLNYPKNLTYKERLIELNLLPLAYQREISDLIFFFKSKVGLIKTDLRKFLCTFKPRYKTRNYDPNNYYLTCVHNQDYYRHSYFIRTAELWNSLPSKVKSLTSLNLFKNSLFNIYVSTRSGYTPPG